MTVTAVNICRIFLATFYGISVSAATQQLIENVPEAFGGFRVVTMSFILVAYAIITIYGYIKILPNTE